MVARRNLKHLIWERLVGVASLYFGSVGCAARAPDS